MSIEDNSTRGAFEDLFYRMETHEKACFAPATPQQKARFAAKIEVVALAKARGIKIEKMSEIN